MSRSITRSASSPLFCWSLATSRNSGKVFSFRHQLRGPVGQFLRIGIFDRILKLRAADPVFDSQILHRLHEEGDSLNLGQLRLQPANDFRCTLAALIARLQIDLDAPAVRGGVGAVHSDERRKTGNGWDLAE